jgi:hypothetical protein
VSICGSLRRQIASNRIDANETLRSELQIRPCIVAAMTELKGNGAVEYREMPSYKASGLRT